MVAIEGILDRPQAELLMRALHEPAAIVGPDLVIHCVNDMAQRLFAEGQDAGQLRSLPGDLVPVVREALSAGPVLGHKVALSDERTLVLDISGVPLKDGGFLLLMYDRTERFALQNQLRRQQDFASILLNRTGALVVVLDREGRIVEFNEACQRLTGYSPDEALGRCVWDFLLVPEEVDGVKGVFASLRAGVFPNQYENFWVTKDGQKRRIAWTNTAIADRSGVVTHVVGTGFDITEFKAREEELRRQALHDPLTGLANRAFLMEQMRLAAHRAAREQDFRFCVMLLDLDGFKQVNDRHGHQFGDQVLVSVANRLREQTRKSDLVCRLGGDEFVILTERLHGPVGAEVVAGRVLEDLKRPFVVKSTPVRVGASIGLAMGGPGDTEPETLLALADRAMYRAKRQGGSRYAFADWGIGTAA